MNTVNNYNDNIRVKLLKKYKIDCKDLDTIGSWIPELEQIFNTYESAMKKMQHKEALNKKYIELHHKWWKNHGFMHLLFIAFFFGFGFFGSGIALWNLPIFALSMIFFIADYIFLKIKNYIPKKYQYTDQDLVKYSDITDEGAFVGHLLVYFKEKLKSGTYLKYYEKAYDVLNAIAKERNITIEELVKKYLKNKEDSVELTTKAKVEN